MLPSEIKDKNKDKKDGTFYPWTSEQEELLAEWSEKATCYRWLHSRSEKSYRMKNYLFTIPVIILSTLTGTANFAMDSFVPPENKQIAMAGVGSVNIFAGILSTLQNFLRYAELMESHRLSEVQWSKFGRNIAVELALEPKRRKPAHEFLKVCRTEYDRLIEQSPPIDDNVIKQFKRTFKKIDIKKPDICNGLDKCKIYKPSKDEKIENMMVNVSNRIKEKQKSKIWKPIEINQHTSILPDNTNIKKFNQDNKKELEGLLTMGRVSSLKNNTKQEISKTILKQGEAIKEVKEEKVVKDVNDVNDVKEESLEPIKKEIKGEIKEDIETGKQENSQQDTLHQDVTPEEESSLLAGITDE